MKESLEDPFLRAKLCFFISVATEFETFLVEFQTDKPMIPFLYQRLELLLNCLLERFVKQEILNANPAGPQQAKLSLKEANLVKPEDVSIGFGAKQAVRQDTKRQGKSEKEGFYMKCREFLTAAAEKLHNRSPLLKPRVRAFACLDPEIMASEHQQKKELLNTALNYLIDMKWIDGVEADNIQSQYMALCSSKTVIEQFATFRTSDHRLDSFFMNICTEQNKLQTSDFQKFFRMVLCLSHGQASVERGFSANKELIIENQKEDSLVAQRLVKDYIHACCSGDLTKFPVPKELILSVRNAASRYKDAKKLTAENRIKEQNASIERKRKAAELKEKVIEQKRLRQQLLDITNEINDLNK